jgi:hypothetical protein
MFALALTCLATPAHSVEREGFLIGFSLGGGRIDCSDCSSRAAFNFDLRPGGSVNERLTLKGEVSGLSRDEPAALASAR